PWVLAVGVEAEAQLRIGGRMQPAILMDLVLALSGRPAGVAQREHRARRSLAARDRLEDIEGGGQADAVVDRQRRVFNEKIARMQHESAARLDRTALEHLHPIGAWGK